jgi:methyl-accepting chemotaxis protein
VNWLAEHLASTSREQSSISEEQVTIVAQILSFLEELAQKVQTVLDNSTNVAKAAHSVLAEAGEVRQSASDVDGSSLQLQEVVNNSLAITGRVREHAEQLADELNQFAGQSLQIVEVTSFIDNIAFRTHILAINAAIEAAQAGEFGERFSVVAQEVKNLAREITGNTEKIRVMLEVTREKIQQSAQNAATIAQEMEQLRNSEGVVNGEVLSLARTTRSSVEKASSIVESAKTMAGLSQQIETLVQQHQVASLQAVSSLAQIKNAAQTNNQATRMLEEDALKLEGLSKQLNLALARVRLN